MDTVKSGHIDTLARGQGWKWTHRDGQGWKWTYRDGQGWKWTYRDMDRVESGHIQTWTGLKVDI